MIDDFPAEIITHIFFSCSSLSAVLALGSTCHRLHDVFKSSHRLSVLAQAVDAEYGPLQDAVQAATFNASQPAHVQRAVPISDALLRTVVSFGRVAKRWEELYPFKKWKTQYADRRLLDSHEKRLVRRSVYRLWLFSLAFHNSSHPRLLRASPAGMIDRARLLHNYSTTELAEMLDVHKMLRDVVANNICPSNGTIRRKFSKRFPDSSHQLLFNIHLNYPPEPSHTASSDVFFNHHSTTSSNLFPAKYHDKFVPSRYHEPGGEGWGDDVLHYYVVEDMLKLDPGQIMMLRDTAPLKYQVEGYTRQLGEWFDNNGETFCQSMAFVVGQRGGDWQEVKDMVADELLGVAVVDEDA